MLDRHLPLLRSPVNSRPLNLVDPVYDGEQIYSGTLTDGENSWPIIEYIPRFVPTQGYFNSFSEQWAKYDNILSENISGYQVYKDRFRKETQWDMNLTGQTIIEAGCGEGSFTNLALDTGATVLSFDISTSVDVVWRKFKNDNLVLVQADIYNIPFVEADKVFCFGVLQHTPDPHLALKCLVDHIKEGGELATDIYALIDFEWGKHNILIAKYFWRKWVKRIPRKNLLRYIEKYVDLMWPLTRRLNKSTFGKKLNQLLMFDDYDSRMIGMDKAFFKEFAKCDINDMLAAYYDNPVRIEEYQKWFEELGLESITVCYGYNGIEGRAAKPRTK